MNLRENRRYARICFDPVTVEASARVDFYHHTHEQATCVSDPPESHVVRSETDASPGEH